MSSLRKLSDSNVISAEIIEDLRAALEELKDIAANLEDAPGKRLLDDKS